VLALAVVFVLLALMSAVLLVVQAAVGAERAATSADLAALAGADAARGLVSGQPCEVALAVVVRHQAALVSCTINGTDRDIVEIATSVELPGPWGTATGRARAGPPP
jgi:secretion/DNA translocation related TadE-like protein